LTVSDRDQPRAHPRFHVAEESYVSYPGGTGTIRDLSLGGIFVLDADPLPVDSELDFDLHLGAEVVRLHGVVRHSDQRAGMGVEFQAVSPASKGLLRACLQHVARGPAAAPEAAEPQPPRTPAIEGPAPPADADEAAARLLRISVELRGLEAAILAANTDHRLLQEFRDAVDQVRLAAWSVEKWRELEAEKRDPYDVLPHLVNERIRRAVQLANEIVQDLDAEEVSLQAQGLEELAHAVDRLHERLARGFRFLRRKK
jgi:hypothetical protein